jgi:predicted phosphodiesterase
VTEGPARFEAFAVEDTSVQLTWGTLGSRGISIELGGVVHTIDRSDQPGSLVAEDLTPDTAHDVWLHQGGRRSAEPALGFTTLPAAPGPELYRFATVSDLHLGTNHFGALHTMRERRPSAPHPVRCAEAGIDEALAWGAKMLVVKGDITEKGRPEQWDMAGNLLANLPVPVKIVPGNHDVYRNRKIEAADGAKRAGLPLIETLEGYDLPGLRLLLVNTCRVGRGLGEFPVPVSTLATLAADAPGPVMFAMHHHLQRHAAPTYWPPGVPGPLANPFLNAVAKANPATMVTSGHTHRNSRRTHRGVVITEVGATKDHPGVWAGYRVYEGEIRQVVRRIARPDVIGWTDYCRMAVGGLWGKWSPGPLDSRSFVHHWPDAHTHQLAVPSSADLADPGPISLAS